MIAVQDNEAHVPPAPELNAAQQLLASLGIAWSRRPGSQRSSSWTKRGPGRYHQKLTRAALYEKQRAAITARLQAMKDAGLTNTTGRVPA